MTRTRISPSLLAWVTHRRTRGDQWKVIERDLRDAGLPACRQQYHAAQDPETRRARGAERARNWRNRRRGTSGAPA
jgi:hypothetical protein